MTNEIIIVIIQGSVSLIVAIIATIALVRSSNYNISDKITRSLWVYEQYKR